MTESKYGKYIMDRLVPPKFEPDWNPPPTVAGKDRGGRVLYMDSENVPGASYMECVWIMPRPDKPEAEIKASVGAHSHDYDEIIAFIGTGHEDPYDLGAEIELYLEDEPHLITRTSLVFIPAGLSHCPLTIRRVTRPVFHYTTGPSKMYV